MQLIETNWESKAPPSRRGVHNLDLTFGRLTAFAVPWYNQANELICSEQEGRSDRT
jgi:hypothetical protein